MFTNDRKISLVTGVSGQDGFFISRQLLKKGHIVVGVSRRPVDSHHVQLLTTYPNYKHYSLPTYTKDGIEKLFLNIKPDNVFHAAGFRDIPSTQEEVDQCFFTNVVLLSMIIATIQKISPKTRLLFISSAEIYGKTTAISCEKTTFNPENEYAISKIEGMQQIQSFQSNGGFGSIAICFNHDSFLSPSTHLAVSVIRKLLHSHTNATFFNTSIKRDFGHASDFARAFELILNHNTPDTFVICTGKPISLDYYIDLSCFYLDIDKSLIQRANRSDIDTYDRKGNSTKIKTLLGWSPQFMVDKLCKNMIYWEKRKSK